MWYDGFINYITFWKIFGLRNLVIFYCRDWSLCNLPVSLPVFGMISQMEELLNIRDNILQGSIRDRYVERQIRNAVQPVIVDCGINVGVTARWWFYLNPQTIVYGIDMMREANDFTMASLPGRFKARYLPITAVLSSSTGGIVDLNYDDPLFGGNNAGAASGYFRNRQVSSMTLDDCLHACRIDSIDLLKVDIEDSAALMFQGAAGTLPKVRNILLETHSKKEREDSICLLREKGFCIRKLYKRHIWLEKSHGGERQNQRA